MKLIRGFVIVLLTALFCFTAVTQAADEVIIDVLDDEVIVLTYRLPLADQEKPITVDRVDGEYILIVNAASGTVRIALGDVTIALTERAVPYITFAFGGEGVSPDSTTSPDSNKCPYCGIRDIDGTHVCPRCNTPYCIHDDIACSYRLNPAPTPWNTKNPDGTTVYFWISSDGTYYLGNPENKKPDDWSPSKPYMDAIATPEPTETPLPTSNVTR